MEGKLYVPGPGTYFIPSINNYLHVFSLGDLSPNPKFTFVNRKFSVILVEGR